MVDFKDLATRFFTKLRKDKPFAIFIIIFVALIILTFFAIIFGLITLGLRSKANWVNYCESNDNLWRLPTAVTPIHYDLDLFNVQLHSAWRYDGKVAIYIKVNKPTSCIEMHAESIEFKTVRLHEGNRDNVLWNSYSTPLSVDRFEDYGHRIKWRFNNVLQAGKEYVLYAEFNGNIRTDLRGFYQSTYTSSDSKKHYLAVTQFESVFARTVFPCFDEPEWKASFRISISLTADNANKYEIISNTPIESIVNQENTKKVSFKTTPVMSTYLLAWVIGELDSITANATIKRDTEVQIPVSIYTPIGESQKAQYALDVAVKVIQEMVLYWDINESILDKMDLVAIPDFEAGAMENWGILTFRSKYLLLSQNATVTAQQGVAFVVAHEVAHQQTGNLYTAKFWNDLWLNEGFANFFEHKLISLALPNAFDTWKIFLTSVSTVALEQDSIPAAHALTFKANTSVEINGMFSTITYDKGASILRMLEHYLGENVFQNWLKKFAKDHKFKSVTTADLLDALIDTFPNTDAVKFRSWTDQSGYPLINVEEQSLNTYIVSQSRFWSHEPVEGDVNRQIWWVPITYKAFSGDTSIKQFSLTTKKSEPFVVNLSTLNVGRTGFYRVNYPKKHWEFLANHIKENLSNEMGELPTMQISVQDRFGLVDDAIALGKSGVLRFGVTLEFLQAFKFEKELTIWDPIISRLMKFQILLGSESSYEAFCRYIHDLLYHVYNYVGWDEDPSELMDKKQLRSIVLKLLIKTNYKPALQEALRRHDEGIPLSRNVQGLTYEAIVRERGELGFTEIEQLFKNADDETKLTYASALLSSPKLSLLKRAIEMCTINGMVRSQDGPYIVKYISENINAIDLGWNFARENVESLAWTYGERIFETKIIPGFTSRFSTRVRYFEIESYLKDRKGFSEFTRNNIMDAILDNIHFKEYSLFDISEWLTQKGFHNPPLSISSEKLQLIQIGENRQKNFIFN